MMLAKRYSLSKKAAAWQATALSLVVCVVGVSPVVFFPHMGFFAATFEGIIVGIMGANIGIWWYETRRRL